jgi:hypothetical protein
MVYFANTKIWLGKWVSWGILKVGFFFQLMEFL